MSQESLPSLPELCSAVRAAGREEILPRFRRVEAQAKADGSLVTEADLAMQRRICEVLGQLDAGRPVLGEEMAPELQEALISGSEDGFWCLDPLDGTTNFSAGFPYFGVSLALIRRGRPILGIVYDPVHDECFSARRGEGCWLNGVPWRPVPPPGVGLGEALAVVDTKRLDAPTRRRLADEAPYRSRRNLGSVALEWCWLAAGRFHLYLHGGQRLWDYAAGSLVLAEAGGSAVLLGREGGEAAALDLAPKAAVAAATPELLGEWRRWLGV